MNTVPAEESATFVAVAQSVQYLSTLLGPLLGTLVAGTIGIGGALLVSAAVRLIAFALFLLQGRAATSTQEQATS